MTRPLSTVEIAALVNGILQSSVYDDRAIRAEIDAGRLRAFEVGRGLRRRRRLRVPVDEFLRWAGRVLREDEIARLQSCVGKAS